MGRSNFPHTPGQRVPHSHGDGSFTKDQFGYLGNGTVIEDGVMVFHARNIFLGANVYVGHQTILKGYHVNEMRIGDGSWIGSQCFVHSAGGIVIGNNVGIAPCVRILTSYHIEAGRELPILHSPIRTAAVEVSNDCDIGVGAILLPGTRLGQGVQVGAGAVVKGEFPAFSVVAGVPARVIKLRP